MSKVLSDVEYSALIQSWQSKLDEANQKILELTKELRDNFHKNGSDSIKLQASIKDAQVLADNAKLEVKKAREDARNSKERAKRFKKRLEKLEQELKVAKKGLDTLKSQK